METNNHNGSELNNVQETWNKNEMLRENKRGEDSATQDETAPATTLDKTIRQEANEYDNENKESRLLSGERASVDDVDKAE